MKEIPLTQGLVTLVDDEDYESLSAYRWFAMKAKNTFYAGRRASKGISGTARLHRVILDAPDGMQVDHANGNGLDNRRANLRLATRAENCRNRRTNCNNTSGYKGASWDRSIGRWRATIFMNGRNKHLGLFDGPAEAHAAYCAAAKELHKEFSRFA